jgi:cytochrome c oxidase cbb3-type subunit 3
MVRRGEWVSGKALRLLWVITTLGLYAQNPGAFPARTKADAAVVARGKAVYGTNCAYCHGEDARGGENGGTNVLRSDVFMKDRNGEVLAPFLRDNAIPSHKFNLTAEQSSDVAAFVHNFGMNSRDPGRMRPASVVVGDAKAGDAYFRVTCVKCHTVAYAKAFAVTMNDPRDLQQRWLMPAVLGGRGATPASKPITITVTEANGQKTEGRMRRLDDFLVTVITADGSERTFRREEGVPKVEVHDPRQAHMELLKQYRDADIHNVTAYLVTLK